jgi:hypothetical protein
MNPLKSIGVASVIATIAAGRQAAKEGARIKHQVSTIPPTYYLRYTLMELRKRNPEIYRQLRGNDWTSYIKGELSKNGYISDQTIIKNLSPEKAQVAAILVSMAIELEKTKKGDGIVFLKNSAERGIHAIESVDYAKKIFKTLKHSIPTVHESEEAKEMKSATHSGGRTRRRKRVPRYKRKIYTRNMRRKVI